MKRDRPRSRLTMGQGIKAGEGFTLVEVVVATALVTLVAGLVLTAYLLAARQVARWQAGLAVENALHVMQNRIASDLRLAERVVWDEHAKENGLLEIVGSDSSRVAYALHDSVLVRNDRPTHGPAVRAASLGVAFRKRDTADSEVSAPENRPVYVEVRLGLVYRGEVSRSVIGAYLRKPPRWTPMRSLLPRR